MNRANTAELLDDPALPSEVVARAYRDLARVHRWLGNTRAILRRVRGAKSVLDIGCGQGALLREIRSKLGIDVIGFDLRPAPAAAQVRIVTGDAALDPLPRADVAIAVCFVHHLSEEELIRLIRNVSRSCRRFIVLDLIRHWLPLCLFRIFVGPFVSRINREDGITSIRRAFTVRELRKLVETAVEGTGARVTQTVAPLLIRQTIDIRW